MNLDASMFVPEPKPEDPFPSLIGVHDCKYWAHHASGRAYTPEEMEQMEREINKELGCGD